MENKKDKIYCGNNKLSPRLTVEQNVIGTPYECMRKGIGVGLNLPVDKDAAGPYEPIVEKKFYCGKKENEMPDKLERMGSPTECLRVGISIGKAKKAKDFIEIRKKRNRKKRSKRAKRWRKKKREMGFSTKTDHNIFVKYILPILIIGSLTLAFALPLYYTKPKFLVDKRKEIDIQKYSIIVYLFLLFVSLIVILIWKYYIL